MCGDVGGSMKEQCCTGCFEKRSGGFDCPLNAPVDEQQ